MSQHGDAGVLFILLGDKRPENCTLPSPSLHGCPPLLHQRPLGSNIKKRQNKFAPQEFRTWEYTNIGMEKDNELSPGGTGSGGGGEVLCQLVPRLLLNLLQLTIKQVPPSHVLKPFH